MVGTALIKIGWLKEEISFVIIPLVQPKGIKETNQKLTDAIQQRNV